MILVSRSKKIIGLEGFGIRIIKTRNNKWKKKLIVASNYYNKITQNLIDGAIKNLKLIKKH